jgi:two-component system LytT family response regulator
VVRPADIDLNGESGLECARQLCDINPKVKIIFATAHSEYMADAFEIYAFDYLVKPFNMDRVTRTLNRIKDAGEFTGRTVKHNSIVSADHEPYKDKLAVKGKEEILFVDIKDIVFIERISGTTRIVSKDGNYNTSQSLTDVEQKLNMRDFIRCHRSYIINLSKISKLTQYGRWTYSVNFRDCAETALMTHYNYDKIKDMFL